MGQNKVKLEKYFKYLRCPVCGRNFQFKNPKILTCLSKKHSFSIDKGIPRLVSGGFLDKSQKDTEKTFSYKWVHRSLKNYGLDDATKSFQHKWYFKRYGFKNENVFGNFIKKQKFVLDAGCGTGWAARWFAEKNPKAIVFAADISKSIDVAANNSKSLDNLLAVQADIKHLPFPNNFFDFISCDQVLHHTSDPFSTFRQLISRLRKGGILDTYVYKRKAPLRELADTFIREKTTKMSFKDCYAFSRAITLLGRSLSQLKANLNVPEDIPLLKIKKGRYDVQRFIYWHFLKCFWNENWGLEKSILTNFDWYHPKNAYRYNPEEIKQWIKKTKLKTRHFYVDDAGISIRVEK